MRSDSENGRQALTDMSTADLVDRLRVICSHIGSLCNAIGDLMRQYVRVRRTLMQRARAHRWVRWLYESESEWQVDMEAAVTTVEMVPHQDARVVLDLWCRGEFSGDVASSVV